jgi:hypothetical protein
VQIRLPCLVLLASALTFLASLFLPWRELQAPTSGTGVLGVLNLFASGGNVEGWGTTVGVAASLAALALAAVAVAALIRPTAASRARFTPIALAMLYLAIGSVLVMRAEEKVYGPRLHSHYAYGMFLGLAVAAIALVGAAALEASAIRRLRPTESLTALLGVGLLASALLPWASPFGPDRTITFPGVTLGPVVLSAAGVCVIVGTALRASTTPYAAFAVAVLTGASLNAIWPNTIRYGAWIALGFALALGVVTAAARRDEQLARPTFAIGLGALAATVLVVSLFLPWQQFCNPDGRPYGHGIGSCIGTTGWANGEFGSFTGVLALLLIFGALAATRLAFPPTEIVLAIATLVAVMGASLGKSIGYPSWSFGYGAYIGFAATGILLFIAFSRVPPPRIESRHALARLGPLAAAFAAFVTVALPLWAVLPDRWSSQAAVLKDWYAVVGLLLTIHLLRRWLESARRTPFPSDQLVALPLALLALTALELIQRRSEGMTWGGGILVGLCLLLALLGWMEPRGRLESIRVPEELWRIDRLPGES